MNSSSTKLNLLFRIVLATLIFSIILKLDSIFQLGNRLAEQGWTLIQILVLLTAIRLTLAGLATALLVPRILGVRESTLKLPIFLKIDGKILLAGASSFLLFCAASWVLSLALGLDLGKPAALISKPDLAPHPDVVGWGYFLVALVPGIWEELTFRGWIQSSLLKRFPPWAAVLFSAAFFSLMHINNLVSQAPADVISGMVMAFFFGLGWGWLVHRAGSVVPAMVSHYLVDCLGLIFLSVSAPDLELQAQYYMALTIIYPLLTVLLTFLLFPGKKRSAVDEPLII